MAWYCGKTIGPATVAEFYLKRAGLISFRPVIHRYFQDRRTGQQKRRVLSLFPGYIFVRIETDDEREAAVSATGVAYLLGNWMGDRFTPRQMPSQWIAFLIEAGPIIEGKKSDIKKGDRVKRAFGAISGLSNILGEVERVDNARFVTVKTTLFGAERRVKIAVDSLEAADLA